MQYSTGPFGVAPLKSAALLYSGGPTPKVGAAWCSSAASCPHYKEGVQRCSKVTWSVYLKSKHVIGYRILHCTFIKSYLAGTSCTIFSRSRAQSNTLHLVCCFSCNTCNLGTQPSRVCIVVLQFFLNTVIMKAGLHYGLASSAASS